MQTATAYYAKPGNRKARARFPKGFGSGGGVWETKSDGTRTGTYWCDKFPADWRELARPKRGRLPKVCGWYADSWQNATVEPHVLQLPSREGEVLYVPATSHTNCDGVTLYLGDVVREPADDAEDAIHDAWARANRCAELEAERARKEDAEFQAEGECERLAEESAKLLAQILADRAAMPQLAPFTKERRVQTAHARAAGALEERIAHARLERSANFARRRELRACPWLIVEGH